MKKFLRVLSYIAAAAAASALTFAVMARQNPETKLTQLENLISEKFIAGSDRTKMEDAAADAMVESLGDRWSYYIPASEYAAHMEQMNNSYVGIGVTIVMEDGGMRIQAVTPGGSAEEAGLRVQDLITRVDGVDIAGKTAAETRTLVRGTAGTTVEITVEREGENLTFPVERRQVDTPVATGILLENHIGLVTIENFDSRCHDETKAAVDTLLEQGAQALIFDVRNNPGGYASELVKVLDMLLPEGEVFRTVDYAGKEKADYSDAACLDLPMAVLVNGDSYSAAEFFAAALQEYEKAEVFGNKTVGKGYFQNTFVLSDGSAVGLSVGKYFTPQGRNLAGVGVTPDREIPVDDETAAAIYYGTLEPENDPQIQAAAEYLTEKLK
ncbi:MAG: S41 family peptidase [Clostridiales bacterium]|nr:S41 family peptidase [Clostridiales bacterium]